MRLRIGHFLHHYPQPGGTTTSVRGLSHALSRLGHEITVYCCGEGGGSSGSSGVRTVWCPPRRPNRFHTPSRITERIARNEDELDLLVIHGMFNPHNIPVAQAARRAGLPYIVCPQGSYHPDMLRKHRWTKRAYARLFERPILKDAAAIQVFVEEQFVQLTDFGVDRPAFAVPNGFDPSQIPPAASEPASGAPSTGPKLLFLGRIDAYTKGLDLLLQALSHGGMTGCLPADLTLDIIGPDWGNQRGLARMSSKLGLANNVRFPGEVKGDDRWLALRTHELTVLPSRHDAFPFVFLESMIAARPLLISDASGSAAVVSRAGCGFVVSPTAESILNGMVRALSMRDEWNTLGQRGRAFAYAQLTWDRIAETAASNYERVLYDNRRSKGIARQGR